MSFRYQSSHFESEREEEYCGGSMGHMGYNRHHNDYEVENEVTQYSSYSSVRPSYSHGLGRTHLYGNGGTSGYLERREEQTFYTNDACDPCNRFL